MVNQMLSLDLLDVTALLAHINISACKNRVDPRL